MTKAPFFFHLGLLRQAERFEVKGRRAALITSWPPATVGTHWAGRRKGFTGLASSSLSSSLVTTWAGMNGGPAIVDDYCLFYLLAVRVRVWGFWFNGAAGTIVVMVAGQRPGQRGARGRSGWLAALRHAVTGLATTHHVAFSTSSAPPIWDSCYYSTASDLRLVHPSPPFEASATSEPTPLFLCCYASLLGVGALVCCSAANLIGVYQ